MAVPSVPEQAPDPTALDTVFLVYETETNGDEIHYYGTPLVPIRDLVSTVWPLFRERGYEVRVTRELGEWILIAEPVELGLDGIPWTNVILALVTMGSTLFAGAYWYHLDPFSLEIIHAWPFAAAIMFVLGVHELGHYVMSRYHQVNASLPYFIPVPTLIGTMGAVIKMEGQIPSRKALFDIGVAGPLAGLAATVAVTVVGLHLPPVETPQEVIDHPDSIMIEIGFPLLLEFLAWATNQPLSYDQPGMFVNPVVIAAWVGMFVTLLNMIPVGQLDGGHIVRSILGDRAILIAQLVPVSLFGLAAIAYFLFDVGIQAVIVWGVWGLIATFLLAVGHARPIDEQSLDRRRIAIGLLAFVLAALCFHPFPIQVHT